MPSFGFLYVHIALDSGLLFSVLLEDRLDGPRRVEATPFRVIYILHIRELAIDAQRGRAYRQARSITN